MMGGGSEQQFCGRCTDLPERRSGGWRSGNQDPRDTPSSPGRFHRAPANTGPAGDRQRPSSLSLNEAWELGDPGAGGPRESARPAALGPHLTKQVRMGRCSQTRALRTALRPCLQAQGSHINMPRACRCDNRIAVPSQVSRDRYVVGKYLPNPSPS